MECLLVTAVAGYNRPNSFNIKIPFCLPSPPLLRPKHKRQIVPLTHTVSPLSLSKVELVL